MEQLEFQLIMIKFKETIAILLSKPNSNIILAQQQQQINNQQNIDKMSSQLNQKTTKTKLIQKQTKQSNSPSTRKQKLQATKDQRFRSAEYDPKFVAPKDNIAKIKIDHRFANKMKSQNFKITASVDKYGRKVQAEDGLGAMEDYYYTQENNDKQLNEVSAKQNLKVKSRKIKQKKKKVVPRIEEEDEDKDNYNEEQSQQQHQNNISKWMKQYNEQSQSQMDDQLDQLVQESDGVWSDSDENVVKGQQVQVTKRLALCNYDWMNINAKDLMLLFSSFKPTAGTILSISVYYSQLGKQKMQNQQRYGPQGIWKQTPNPQQQQEQENQKQKQKKHMTTARKHQQEQAFNQRKLRAYEKQRLKYCYAVIQCNSKSTADQLYKECDGNQFQNSNILFDLRFVPDQIQFDGKMLKEKCDQIPVSGEVKNFVSRALGHSSVALTWEDPQLNSVANLKKKNWNKMSEKQMDNIDWSMYINENAQIANDNLNKMINKNQDKTKQKQKIQNKQVDADDKNLNVSDWRKQCNKKHRNKEDDIEITFTSGFDSQIPKREKDSLNKQLKTRKDRWRAIQEEKKKKQQIELLVEKSDKKEFVYNPNDDRFKAVLENPAYHIDPSNPKFDHRKVGAVFEQVVKKNRNKNTN